MKKEEENYMRKQGGVVHISLGETANSGTKLTEMQHLFIVSYDDI